MRRLVLIAFLLGLSATSASADPGQGTTITATAVLRAGPLKLTAPQVELSAVSQTSASLTIADARGSGAGWVLHASSPASFRIARVTLSCAVGDQCLLPKGYGEPHGDFVIRAAPKSGMGLFKVKVLFQPLADGAPPAPLRFYLSRKG